MVKVIMITGQWRHGQREKKENYYPPKFGAVGKLSRNCLVGKLLFKNVKFGTESPIWGKFKGKIKTLSTHNLFCRKSAVFVGKLQLPAPPTF